MRKVFLPLITTQLTVSGRKTVYYTNDKKVFVEAPCKLMQQLALLCDGKRSIGQIVQTLKDDWDETSVRNLINGLRRQGILINARTAWSLLCEEMETPDNPASSL